MQPELKHWHLALLFVLASLTSELPKPDAAFYYARASLDIAFALLWLFLAARHTWLSFKYDT